MSNKKGKLPPLKTNALAMRSMSIQSSSADSAQRSVRVVTATENPIDRWDDRRGEVVAEVLEMDGMRMRPGAKQIPIVDSHDTTTVRNVLGSLRNLTIEGDEFGGVAYFASDDDSQRAYSKLLDGHITDFSITAQPNEVLELRAGQKYTTSRGTEVIGPANVITNWTALDASLVATGADSRSTVRRSYTDLAMRKRSMDPALLEQLKTMGLPEGMEDPNQVLAWVVGKLGKPAESEVVESMADEMPMEEPVEKMDETDAPPVEEKPAEEVQAAARAAIEGEIKRALEADQKRRSEIQATCKLAKVERAFADQLCDAGVSVEVAKQKVIERMATQPLGSSVGADVKVTESSVDKFIAAAKDGLIARAVGRTSIKRSLYEGDKPSAGYEDFKNLNLIRLATLFAERAGLPVQRMNNPEISRAVMRMSTLQGFMDVSQRYRIQRSDFSAYHTTGSFANLLLDASNKTLLAGYEEAPYTWNLWARQANSVDDFKNINRIRFSEAPNPEEVPEGADYPEKAMSDSKESYKVAKYGESFTVSWETIINDDLDALSRIPAMHGNAMRRFQNKKVYEILTSNPTMGDGYSLFSSSHASGDNTSGAAAAPSVTTLNAMFVKMMTQKGLTNDAIINVVPKFVIVPVAYGATLLQLIASLSDPAAGGSAAGNANTLNIYGPNGMRPIVPIIEPQLDANSSTTWYGAADNAQIDTVELSFLSGEESPVVENEYNMKNDTYYNKIRQTFGTKAIDWRGLYVNKA